MRKALALTVCLIMSSQLFACNNAIEQSEVSIAEQTTQTNIDLTTVHKETVSADIEACIREKVATFEEECELLELWYDKEKSEQIIDSYMKSDRASANKVKRENIIVIMSDLKTGENTWSFEPNAVYTDWNWILVRENQDSEWTVDDYGNE